MLPVHPILLFQESTAGEAHDSVCVLLNVSRLNDDVTLEFNNGGVFCHEIDPIIELIVSELGEIVLGDNR